jgi:hypothetical protein
MGSGIRLSFPTEVRKLTPGSGSLITRRGYSPNHTEYSRRSVGGGSMGQCGYGDSLDDRF